MVPLRSPVPEVRYTLAGLYGYSSVPDRVALQALALAVAWPFPPWESAAQLGVDRASQEERESRQFLHVARPEEVSSARQSLLSARTALQKAQADLEAARFAFRDVHGDARLAMARLAEAGVAPAVWSDVGAQLLAAWTSELMPASSEAVAEALTFTLPPPALMSDGGSISPTGGPAMR
jgi:hypothetical protein